MGRGRNSLYIDYTLSRVIIRDKLLAFTKYMEAIAANSIGVLRFIKRINLGIAVIEFFYAQINVHKFIYM